MITPERLALGGVRAAAAHGARPPRFVPLPPPAAAIAGRADERGDRRGYGGQDEGLRPPDVHATQRDDRVRAVAAHGARRAGGRARFHDAPPAVPPPDAAIAGGATLGRAPQSGDWPCASQGLRAQPTRLDAIPRPSDWRRSKRRARYAARAGGRARFHVAPPGRPTARPGPRGRGGIGRAPQAAIGAVRHLRVTATFGY